VGDALFTHTPGPGEHVVYFGTLEFITPVLFDVGVFLVVFGFCIGVVGAMVRAQVRIQKLRERQGQPATLPQLPEVQL
jgi:hypothetical protein